ncbi:MAG: L,D-transpeptidase [Clostridia bacterium]|nr:L,D-transpeptidase [Clostridia bacterium]
MAYMNRLIAFLLVLFLLPANVLAEEEDFEWEDEDLSAPDTLLATDVFYHTPNEHSPVKCDHDVCFWHLEMGRMDEAAIWKVLTQPVTVIEGKQREQVRILAEPDEKCKDYTGVVTCASQAVHVLREEGDWTLIEAYSSSEEDSAVKVFAEQFQGYVKTRRLKTVEVDQHYGLVIDKLQQRLYVFKDGRLFTTMLCSTGFAKDKATLFHETPAGEYLMISWVGGFQAETLWCAYGIRINSGILIHEVPSRQETNKAGETYTSYARCERYLGEKASHGCVRVQRQLTPEGVNAKWLWDHLSRNPCTKVIIWDDLNRELAYPSDDLLLYYNPNKGENYHSQPTCSLVKDKYEPMTAFRYGELDEKPYRKLTPCPGCAPMPRKDKIDELNKKSRKR